MLSFCIFSNTLLIYILLNFLSISKTHEQLYLVTFQELPEFEDIHLRQRK